MDLLFTARTLARRGLLTPGRPDRVADQLATLRRWGFTLAGEVRAAYARDPDRTAVIDEQRGPISYRVLLHRAQRLATGLAVRHGVGRGQRVGLLHRNHAGLIEAMIACSLLGADAVLINTALSGAQLRAVTEQQRLRVLLHDRDLADLAGGIGCDRVDESGMEQLIEGSTAVRRDWRETRAGRIIVLTSGTTGAPKGARRPVPPDAGVLTAIIDRIPLRVGDRVHIAAPLFHTWGLAALQLTFAVRGTVVLRRRFDPVTAVHAIDAYRVTAVFAVPVMLQRLLESDARPGRRPGVVAVSGSALPGNLATAFMDRWGDVLYNMYGSTEVSYASIATPADLRRAPGCAGRPPHGTRLAVLDADGRPLRAGEIGYIHVGSRMLFEGYTGGERYDLNNGMLATGDLGHLDDQGLLHVDGRTDDMIVSGGENVFPRPVEDLLATLPQVRDVAVVGVPDPDYGQRLAAFLVLHPGQQLSVEDVREYVRHYLARYSVPRDVHFVPDLPRTATGKVVPRLLRERTYGA